MGPVCTYDIGPVWAIHVGPAKLNSLASWPVCRRCLDIHLFRRCLSRDALQNISFNHYIHCTQTIQMRACRDRQATSDKRLNTIKFGSTQSVLVCYWLIYKCPIRLRYTVACWLRNLRNSEIRTYSSQLAGQDHPRSSILVSIKSAYATSY